MTGRNLARALACAAALAAVGPQGRAADPVPYAATIAATGDPALDQAARDAALLVSLHDAAPVGPFALVARARADRDRLGAVLQSFGHYAGEVRVSISGRDIDDPELPGALDAAAPAPPVAVAITLTPGKLFHLRHVDLTGDVPAEARAALALQPGAPARAADVVAARERLLAALRDSGHALAHVSEPVATLAPAEQALDVSFGVQAGPRVQLGRIAIGGLRRMDESFVRERLLLQPGERYDPAAIETARQDLASIGVFSSVRIDTAAALDAAGRLPVKVEVTERPLHSVNLGASYSTDLGGSLSASWTHHDLFGGAEQLTLSAAATELGGTAARQPGYNVSALLTLPDWGHRDQSLSFNAAAIKEYLDAYNRQAFLAGAALSRRITPELTASVALQGEQAHFVQEGVGRDYLLAQLPLTVGYDTTGHSLDPVRGFRAAATVTPSDSLGTRNALFVIAQVSGSAYFDLSGGGRSVVAVRGLVGGVEGTTTFDIPPDQRFYAGGGGTIRGFRFQSVGPQFADRRPQGGTSVDVGSVELRQRFGASYGAVAFVDAGQVGSGGTPFTGELHVGAGLGARYYTGFGPIRVDFAMPLTRQSGGDAFELYLGIGQAF